jgi:uncharacterized membrane protein
MDNPRSIVNSALAAAMALGLVGGAQAHADGTGKERCYGVSKAGQNDCGNLAGTHDCSGMATVDKDVGEWRYVPKGTCKAMKGLSEAQAKIKFKAQRKG